MSVERNSPTASGNLLIKPEPGVGVAHAQYQGYEVSNIIVTGNLGIRFLSTLIEEATALRDELRAAVS